MAKATHDTPGVIYFLHSPATKSLKIGFTINLEHRMKELRCGSPTELVLLNYVLATYQTELALHAVFHELRMHGEWFRDDITLLDFIKRLPQGKNFSSSQIALA